MASYRPQLAILNHLLKGKKPSSKGFTLTELLVSIVMSTIIIGTLLYVIVELLGVNTREESLTQTQQDMKRALSYIKQDVSEAVWVYSTPAAVVGELTDVPTAAENAEPILAFWRLDPVDISGLPDDCADASNEAECETLKIRQNEYTLVVYFQQENSGNDIWEGPARILRYELPKYDDVDTLDINDGYSDPTLGLNSFRNWDNDDNDASGTDGNIAVLTDYVDASSGSPDEPCPSSTDEFEAFPADVDNFYVCVRSGEGNTGRTNQSLFVYLRGNALSDRSVVFGPSSDASKLPTLETEVLVRGVIEESGNR
jgi:type II secretory pathway pseudopilin PulG